MTSKLLQHPVWARKVSSDFKVFDQIFAEREYRCLDRIAPPQLIVDCGANVGYSSAYFLSRYPKCTVVAIEPDPSNFALLSRNLEPYAARCHLLNAAVWWRKETLRFKTPNTEGAEWACSVEPGMSGGSSVSAITIPDVLEMVLNSRISVLKIDIEGAERDLFAHDPTWLDAVDNIAIELHGDACRDAFLRAIQPRLFDISLCGELTCCLKVAAQEGQMTNLESLSVG